MNAIACGNLLADIPATLNDEQVRMLAGADAVRIERIVSTGQSSPPGFWYDQAHRELVVVIAGSAMLRLVDEAEPRHLRAGDWIDLPAHCRHRVDWTDPANPTVWLAIHYPPDA